MKKNIQENILASNIEGKLQGTVGSQIQMRKTGKDSTLEKLEKALNANQTQTNKLVDAIAHGVYVDTMLFAI